MFVHGIVDQYKYYPSPLEASTYNNVVKTNPQLPSECTKGYCKSNCNSNIKYCLFSIQYLNIVEFHFLLFDGDIENILQSPHCVYLRCVSIHIRRRIRYANLWDTCNLDRSRWHLKFWPLFHIVDTNICSSFSTRKLKEMVAVALQPRLRVWFISNGLVCECSHLPTHPCQYTGTHIVVILWVVCYLMTWQEYFLFLLPAACSTPVCLVSLESSSHAHNAARLFLQLVESLQAPGGDRHTNCYMYMCSRWLTIHMSTINVIWLILSLCIFLTRSTSLLQLFHSGFESLKTLLKCLGDSISGLSFRVVNHRCFLRKYREVGGP